jgi:phosphatidylserine decarboxylase
LPWCLTLSLESFVKVHPNPTRPHLAQRPAAAGPVSWLRRMRDALLLQEDLNFLLTNRLPRVAVSRAMGRFSRIENRWLAWASIAIWRLFTDLDLTEAEPRDYRSLQDCFTRALRPGMRPFDPRPGVVASPSDGIVGACGPIQGTEVFQAKGFPYRLEELLGDALPPEPWRDGVFVTLRLTSAMYHRFHAPHDAVLEQVVHMAGDTWNVNPIALERVERLFCRNERAALRLRLAGCGQPLLVVPVAAILVASLRLHAPALRLHTAYRGPDHIDCDVPLSKGQEMGWFEHGSTILVFAPRGFTLAPGVGVGVRMRAGEPLLQLPQSEPA